MANLSQKPSEKSNDFRVKITSRIWAYATVMLAIWGLWSAATTTNSGATSPIMIITDSGSEATIPIAIISGATISTASVWKFSNQNSTNQSETSEKFKELEGRITDLEIIIASADLNWQQSIEPTAKSSSTFQTLPSSSQARKEN